MEPPHTMPKSHPGVPAPMENTKSIQNHIPKSNSQPTIESLSSLVTAHSIRLSKCLAAKSHPDPTFEATGTPRYAGEDAEIRTARQDLVRAARDLASLAESPEDHILSQAWSSVDAANLAILDRFSLPQLVPLPLTSSSTALPSGTGADTGIDGISAADLATAADLPEDVVLRTMRYAVAKGFFEEMPAGNAFKHNASSALLAQNEYIRDIVGIGSRELSSIVLRIADALELQQKERQSLKGLNGNGEKMTNGHASAPAAAFNIAFPGENSVFEYLSKQPELAGRYHKYMVARHNTSRWTIEHMVRAYDWAATGGQTVVDAGGSSGHTVLALSQTCPPSTRFIIQDIDPVALEQGKAAVARLTNNVAPDRFEFQTHNLFEPQPVRANIYIFRHIFHDWADDDVVKMLQSLTPALDQGARILVSEGIVPERAVGRSSLLDDQLIRIEDMVMLGSHGARERTVADFTKLFQQADPRYKYMGKTGGTNGAFQSLLEFQFEH